MKGEEYNQADIADSFQKAVTDVLVAKAYACRRRIKTNLPSQAA